MDKQKRRMELRRVLIKFALAVIDGYETEDISLNKTVENIEMLYK